jgi:Xaa-Pro aminopeptidase
MQVLTHSRQMQKHPYASSACLEDNAPVVIHLGATCEGYASKMCRTVFLGEPHEESVRVYETLKQAQKIAAAHLKPGVTCAGL